MSKSGDLEHTSFGLRRVRGFGKRQSSSTPADTEYQSSSGFFKRVKEKIESVRTIFFSCISMGLEF